MGMKKASQKFGDYKKLDEACILGSDSKESKITLWVVVLQEKARVLFEQLYPESTAGFCSKEESFFQARRFFHNLQQK